MPRQRRSRLSSTGTGTHQRLPTSPKLGGHRAQSLPARSPASAANYPSVPAVPATRQPSAFQQMATTAAGVAGHAMGHALAGGGLHENDAAQYSSGPDVSQQQIPAAYERQDSTNAGPCAQEIKQFVECAQNQGDITLCQGFNEALKQCRLSHGV